MNKPAELHVRKVRDTTKQNCGTQKSRGSTSHSERFKNWRDTSKLHGTDAHESTRHGERCKCTGITHHENKKIVLRCTPSRNSRCVLTKPLSSTKHNGPTSPHDTDEEKDTVSATGYSFLLRHPSAIVAKKQRQLQKQRNIVPKLRLQQLKLPCHRTVRTDNTTHSHRPTATPWFYPRRVRLS